MNFEQNNFINIGAYFKNENGDLDRKVEDGIRVTERVSLVYVILVNNECKYIGKTIQGFTRPLSYHKNNVMKVVLHGIREELNLGHEVKIFARKFDIKHHFEDLELDLCEAYEQALIRKYKPDWNKHKQK